MEFSTLQADLIINKEKGRLRNPIGRLFCKYNVIEYKSPEDGMTIDDYYKVIAYGCLYKAEGSYVNNIKPDEITLTMIRDGRPYEMMKMLVQYGMIPIRHGDGIYYLEGKVLFPSQIIVGRELSGNENIWLKSLTRNLQRNTADELIRRRNAMRPEEIGKIRYADAVLQSAMSLNKNVFEQIKKEGVEMIDALRDLMKPEIDEALAKAKMTGRDEGIQQGVQQGVQQGMERGISKGIDNTKAAVKLIMKGGLSIEEIAAESGLDVKDVKELQEQLRS